MALGWKAAVMEFMISVFKCPKLKWFAPESSGWMLNIGEEGRCSSVVADARHYIPPGVGPASFNVFCSSPLPQRFPHEGFPTLSHVFHSDRVDGTGGCYLPPPFLQPASAQQKNTSDAPIHPRFWRATSVQREAARGCMICPRSHRSGRKRGIIPKNMTPFWYTSVPHRSVSDWIP